MMTGGKATPGRISNWSNGYDVMPWDPADDSPMRSSVIPGLDDAELSDGTWDVVRAVLDGDAGIPAGHLVHFAIDYPVMRVLASTGMGVDAIRECMLVSGVRDMFLRPLAAHDPGLLRALAVWLAGRFGSRVDVTRCLDDADRLLMFVRDASLVGRAAELGMMEGVEAVKDACDAPGGRYASAIGFSRGNIRNITCSCIRHGDARTLAMIPAIIRACDEPFMLRSKPTYGWLRELSQKGVPAELVAEDLAMNDYGFEDGAVVDLDRFGSQLSDAVAAVDEAAGDGLRMGVVRYSGLDLTEKKALLDAFASMARMPAAELRRARALQSGSPVLNRMYGMLSNRSATRMVVAAAASPEALARMYVMAERLPLIIEAGARAALLDTMRLDLRAHALVPSRLAMAAYRYGTEILNRAALAPGTGITADRIEAVMQAAPRPRRRARPSTDGRTDDSHGWCAPDEPDTGRTLPLLARRYWSSDEAAAATRRLAMAEPDPDRRGDILIAAWAIDTLDARDRISAIIDGVDDETLRGYMDRLHSLRLAEVEAHTTFAGTFNDMAKRIRKGDRPYDDEPQFGLGYGDLLSDLPYAERYEAAKARLDAETPDTGKGRKANGKGRRGPDPVRCAWNERTTPNPEAWTRWGSGRSMFIAMRGGYISRHILLPYLTAGGKDGKEWDGLVLADVSCAGDGSYITVNNGSPANLPDLARYAETGEGDPYDAFDNGKCCETVIPKPGIPNRKAQTDDIIRYVADGTPPRSVNASCMRPSTNGSVLTLDLTGITDEVTRILDAGDAHGNDPGQA